MSIQVQQLLEGKDKPVCITRDEPITKALTLMVNFDYSQLPVTRPDGDIEIPEGLITYEGIVRGIRNFKAKLEDLKVKDVMVAAPTFREDDDLFDILNKLKEANAVLVKGVDGKGLVGIVTSYDSTQYFRDRTEDLMRVEDIESTIKDFVDWAYTAEDGTSKKEELDRAIASVTARPNQNASEAEKKKKFDELSLSEYISLLVYRNTWSFFEPIFGIPRENLIELLNNVRTIRNALAHFRGDIMPQQRETLKFCADWFTKRMEEFDARLDQEFLERERIEQLFQNVHVVPATTSVNGEKGEYSISTTVQDGTHEIIFSETGDGGGRYALLADWLQSQPGDIDKIPLTFNQVEEIINSDLPPSARTRRVWWANDSVGHSHSQLWLEAGWRTSNVNMTEETVVFTRIVEVEKEYIEFFSSLQTELIKTGLPVKKYVSIQGRSWMTCYQMPDAGPGVAVLGFSFTRDRKFRVELYIDSGDKEKNKLVFDLIHKEQGEIQQKVKDAITWERIDQKRASRIAIYHSGHISDSDDEHEKLRTWAVTTMVTFFNAIVHLAVKVIEQEKG